MKINIFIDSEWEKAEDECKAKYFEGLDQIKTGKHCSISWMLMTIKQVLNF